MLDYVVTSPVDVCNITKVGAGIEITRLKAPLLLVNRINDNIDVAMS